MQTLFSAGLLLLGKVLTESALGKAMWRCVLGFSRLRARSGQAPRVVPGVHLLPLRSHSWPGLGLRAAVAVMTPPMSPALERVRPSSLLVSCRFHLSALCFCAMCQTLPLLLIFPQPLWVSPTRMR